MYTGNIKKFFIFPGIRPLATSMTSSHYKTYNVKLFKFVTLKFNSIKWPFFINDKYSDQLVINF